MKLRAFIKSKTRDSDSGSRCFITLHFYEQPLLLYIIYVDRERVRLLLPTKQTLPEVLKGTL